METGLLYEFIGYLASILIAISLTMRSILKLRMINLIGAACFTVYGFLISALPVTFLNGLIVAINLYYLNEMRRSESYFTLLQSRHDAAYLGMFLEFYAEDIRKFFPHFDLSPSEGDLVWFVLRDLVPVGLFVAERKGPEGLLVHLDYVIPGYRDLRPGEFLYKGQANRFEDQGISYLESIPQTKAQRDYVERMGFLPVSTQGDLYRRSVP
jgi:hypothetical protein